MILSLFFYRNGCDPKVKPMFIIMFIIAIIAYLPFHLSNVLPIFASPQYRCAICCTVCCTPYSLLTPWLPGHEPGYEKDDENYRPIIKGPLLNESKL